MSSETATRSSSPSLKAFVARIAATFKFIFVTVAILYLLVVGVTCFFRRPERERLPSFREQPVTINRPDADAS